MIKTAGTIFSYECSIPISNDAFRFYVYLRVFDNQIDPEYPTIYNLIDATGQPYEIADKAIKELKSFNLVKVHKDSGGYERYESNTKTALVDRIES